MAHDRFDEHALVVLARRTRKHQAEVCQERIRSIEKRARASFVELGILVSHVERYELWKECVDKQGAPYKNFDSWMGFGGQESRATRYAARSIVTKLDGVGISELSEIAPCNLKLLALLPPKGKSDPEILSAAKTQSEKQFRKTARTRFPDSHIEAIEPMKLKPEASQREKIDEAIAAAMLIYELPSREAALECIAAWFMDAQVDLEDYQGLSHREAYENRTLSRKAQTMAAHA